MVVMTLHTKYKDIKEKKTQKGQSQKTLKRGVDKEQGKRNKVQSGLKQRGVRSSLPTFWGILMTDFYKTK